jgi:hypothetical protein
MRLVEHGHYGRCQGCKTEESFFRFSGKGKRFSLLRILQAGSATHLVSYIVGTWASFPWGKATAAWDWRPRIENDWSCTSNSPYVFFTYIPVFFCGAATQHESWPPHSWGFLDHTQRRTTVGRTPLNEWSVCHRDLYLTTQHLNRQISEPPVGFEPTISAGERSQTYVSDRAATGTGAYIPRILILSKFFIQNWCTSKLS